MPRDGAIIFGDLIGKLDVLRVECAKCGRAGQYELGVPIAKLLAQVRSRQIALAVPLTAPKRTCRDGAPTADFDPGCVKTPKARKPRE
jgi:hypothetical protein